MYYLCGRKRAFDGWKVCIGKMAEWSNAAVLKTVEQRCSGGSNPSLSAIWGKKARNLCNSRGFFVH